MRKTFCTALLLLASFSAFAQDVVTTDANTQNGLIAVVILIIVVAIMAHMIYENFFRKDLNTDYTAAAFRDARKAQNLGDMSAVADGGVMSESQFRGNPQIQSVSQLAADKSGGGAQTLQGFLYLSAEEREVNFCVLP